MPRISLDLESWRQGRTAGLVGGRAICPADVRDRLAYASGFIEGKALRMPRAAVRRGRRSRTRTAEGRERAKGRSVRLGRKSKLTEHQKREAIRRRGRAGEPVRGIARSFSVSHSTISRLTT